MPAQKVRDVRKLADSRAVFELDFPLEELPGLPLQHVSGGGPVHARLSFGREQGYAMAQVDLQATLAATCQRCLGSLPLPVQSRSAVLIVESEQEAESAPAGWETFLASEGRLWLEALVSEELLLALPIVPLHEEGRCPAGAALAVAQPAQLASETAAEPAQATTRPFADLRALLERANKGR